MNVCKIMKQTDQQKWKNQVDEKPNNFVSRDRACCNFSKLVSGICLPQPVLGRKPASSSLNPVDFVQSNFESEVNEDSDEQHDNGAFVVGNR